MSHSSVGREFHQYDERTYELIDEFSRRVASGEPISMEAFAAAYPDYSEALRDLLPAVSVLQELRSDEELGEPKIPKALGDFRIIRQIGQGGMGFVYEAEQISLGRRVAVKVLPFAGMLNSTQLQRFKNEAHAAASLHHPNIVNAFYFGQERGVHFYAMRLIEGESLAEVIRARQAEDGNTAVQGHSDTEPVAALSTVGSNNRQEFYRSVARLGIQVARALAHAHSLSIIHRDIKPSNIMIDRDGHTWVTDFGLASTRMDSDLTLSGDVLGTLRYMSPEQAAGDANVDQRSDVYSLGATLYELLTGRPVLEGSTQAELIKQLENSGPPRLRAIDSNIPRDLENILLKSIAKLPTHRYAAATDLAADLQRFLDHKPVRARRLSQRHRLLRWSRRNPALAGSMVIVFGLLLFLAVAGPVVAFRQIAAARSTTRTSHAQSTLRAFEAWNRGHVDRVPELLWAHEDDPYAVSLRGFAWRYLWNRYRRLDETAMYAHGLSMSGSALSPDGQRFAVFGQKDGAGVLQFCDAKQLTLIKEIETTAILDGAYTSDGKLFLAVGKDNTLRIWDTVEFQESFSQAIDPRTVGKIAISPQGGRVALFRYSGPHVDVWKLDAIRANFADGPEQSLNHDRVRSVAFATDGERIASCGGFGFTKVWSVTEGRELIQPFRIDGNTEIPAICFHPKRDVLATGGTGIKLWDVSTGKLLTRFGESPRDVTSLVFSADGTRLVAGGEGQVEVWDVDRQMQTHIFHGAPVNCSEVRYSNSDGVILANFRAAEVLRKWSVPAYLAANTSATFVEFVGESSDVLAITSSDYRLGDQGQGSFRLWDIDKGAELYAGRPGRYGMTACSPVNGNRIAVPHNNAIRISDLQQPESPVVLKGHNSQTTSTTFSPDGELLASASYGLDEPPELLLWDLTSTPPTPTSLPLPDRFGPARIEFSPDGKILVVAGGSWSEAAVILYDVATKARINSLVSIDEQDGPFAGLCFSPDETLVATAGYNRRILLFDWKQGQRMLQIPTRGHSAIASLVFSKNSKRIVAGFLSGHVGIWDIASGEQIAELDARSPVYDLDFSASGNVLAAGCANGSAVLWFEGGTKQVISPTP